jgi:oligoendopeptidase F
MHIMVLPFYYIDYALAQTVAMQLWGKYLEDKKAAWEKYLAFVEQAGTKAFAQLVTGVDLKSPFEDGYIRSIKAPAMEWIRKHQN